MKLALCLFHYFPFGGLQRDFLRIALTCIERGHEVDVYTTSWEGDLEPQLHIKLLPPSGWQNHTRYRSFSYQLQHCLQQQHYDLVIGFNKMPGLDVYYSADGCYQSRIKNQRSFWYRFLPRYHQYLRDEYAVFSPQAKTTILILSASQQDEYRQCYQTPLQRFHLLPPGIDRDRIAPPNAPLIREQTRAAYQVTSDEKVLLLVGSGFKTKGLDRVLWGLASLPQELRNQVRLWVVGQSDSSPFLRQAKELGISPLITFLGGRHDVRRFYLAADLLVHPAYHENTGTVLLEAMVAALPVLTVDTCGYAHYVHDANAGVVLPSPFDQNNFNFTLQNMLLSAAWKQWQENGLAFAQSADIYSLPDKAADIIESLKQPYVPSP